MDGVITFQTDNLGQIQIKESDVKSIEELQSGVKQWPEHFQTAFHFITPTGYGLKKGEGAYQNVWIMFNSATYGITDNFSIGVGTIPLFLFGADIFPIWITPKFSVPIIENKVNLGAGGLFGSVEREGFGSMYGLATFGSRNANFSIGLAKSLSDGADESLVLVNGSLRITQNTYLLMENFLVAGEAATYIGGRSMLGRASIEYGIVRGSDFDFIGIPILGLTIPLHKK